MHETISNHVKLQCDMFSELIVLVLNSKVENVAGYLLQAHV